MIKKKVDLRGRKKSNSCRRNGRIFDRGASYFDHGRFDDMEEKSNTNQRQVGQQHEAQQSRLAMLLGVKTEKKTRKRTGGAAAADRVEYGCSSSARDDDGPTSSTSFGKIAKPPALPIICRDDALVDEGAEAPKPFISPGEMRTTTTTGGLLPAGTALTAMRTIFPAPPPSWILGEEINKKPSRKKFSQLAPPCWRKINEI